MKNDTADSRDVFEWFPTEGPRRAPLTGTDLLPEARRVALDLFATERRHESAGSDSSSTSEDAQRSDDLRPRFLSSVFDMVIDEQFGQGRSPEYPRRSSSAGRGRTAGRRMRWAGVAAAVMLGVLIVGFRPAGVSTPSESLTVARPDASLPGAAPVSEPSERAMPDASAPEPHRGAAVDDQHAGMMEGSDARPEAAAVTRPVGRSGSSPEVSRKTASERTITVRPTTGQLPLRAVEPAIPAEPRAERPRPPETVVPIPIHNAEMPAPLPHLAEPIAATVGGRPADAVSPATVVPTFPVAPREPVVSPPVARSPAPALPTVSGEKVAIRSVLDRYETAYSNLDVHGAQTVWPSVDAKALGHAFDQLEEQEVRFDNCDIYLAGATADAYCGGRARYVPKVGNRKAHEGIRRWKFSLRKAEKGWVIDSVKSQ